MIIESVNRVDVDAIVKLWNRNLDERYLINSSIFYNRVIADNELFRKGTFCIKENGRCIALIVSKINRDIFKFSNCAWISVQITDKKYRNKGIGSLLYNNAEKNLKKVGIREIKLGGETNYIFKGIPMDIDCCDKFWVNRGFKIEDRVHYQLLNNISEINFDKLKSNINFMDDFNAKKMISDNLNNVIFLFYKYDIIGFCRIDRTSYYTASIEDITINEKFKTEEIRNRLIYEAVLFIKESDMKSIILNVDKPDDIDDEFKFKKLKVYKAGNKKINL